MCISDVPNGGSREVVRLFHLISPTNKEFGQIHLENSSMSVEETMQMCWLLHLEEIRTSEDQETYVVSNKNARNCQVCHKTHSTASLSCYQLKIGLLIQINSKNHLKTLHDFIDQNSAFPLGNFSFNLNTYLDFADLRNLRQIFTDLRIKSVQKLNLKFRMSEIPKVVFMELKDTTCLIESITGNIGPSGLEFLKILRDKVDGNSRVNLKFNSVEDFDIHKLSSAEKIISGN